MKHFSGWILVVALAIASVAAGHADPAQSTTMPAEDGVKALALRWFLQMQAGQDRPHAIHRRLWRLIDG